MQQTSASEKHSIVLRALGIMHSKALFENIENLRLKTYNEFGKSKKDVEEDVEIIKKWLQTQPHLPEIMPDTHIRNFLIIAKFSLEKTKQNIDMYYSIRSLIPEFYDRSNPKLPEMRNILDSVNVCLHPTLFENSHRIYWYSIKKPNWAFRDFVSTVTNIGEVRLLEDSFSSVVHVVDAKNFSLNDVTKLTPSLLMKALTIYQKIFSFRFKAAYIINAPSYITNVLALVKGLVKPKIFERVHVSSSDDILKNLFTIDDLPEDYGGKGPSLQELTDIIKIKFEQHQERFDKLDKMRVREDLRPQPLNNDEVLGFYGSFKKLSVD